MSIYANTLIMTAVNLTSDSRAGYYWNGGHRMKRGNYRFSASDSQTQSILLNKRYHVLSITIFVAGLLLSVSAFIVVHNRQQTAVYNEFIKASQSRVAVIVQSYAQNVQLVRATKAFFSVKNNVSRKDFHRFTQSLLSHYSGVQALEWIPRVSQKQRRKYELDAQLDFPGFQFRERAKQGTMTPAVLRPEYYPAYYVEPLQGNENATGFDLGSDSIRLKSINLARDTGEIVVSPGIRLVQEGADQYGFLVLDPIYQNLNTSSIEDRQANFIGLIAGVFRIGDMVEDAISRNTTQGLDFSIYDDTEGLATQKLLYSHLARTRNNLPTKVFPLFGISEKLTYTENIKIGGQTLIIKVTPAPGYFNTAPNMYAWGAPLVGLFSTLFWIIYVRTMRRNLQALVRSELSLNKAQEIAHIGNWEWDLQKNEIVGSDEAYRIFGKRPQAFEPNFQSYLEIVHPDDRSLVKSAVDEAITKNKKSFSISHRVVLPDGSVRFLHYSVEVAYAISGKPVRFFGIMQDVTERHLAEEALSESRQRLDLALQSACMGVWIFDLITNKRHYDELACQLLGIDPETFTGTAEEVFRVVHPDDLDMLQVRLARSVEEGISYDLEFRVIWPDGNIHHIASRAKIEHKEDGRPWKFIGVLWDVTERKRAEITLRESQERLGLAVRSASMGVWSYDLVANKRYYDDQTCHLLGIDPATFAGTAEELFQAVHPDDIGMLRIRMAQTIDHNVPYEVEYRAVWPDGSIHHLLTRGKLVCDNQNKPLKVYGVVFEITEWKEAQKKIHNLAFYDPLTGLPNRRLLSDQLQKALASCTRNGLTGAILFIDLDNFKTINDTLGHALGDALLVQVAARLASCVREEDTVARIGGDEFVVMLEYLNEDIQVAATQTESVGDKILAALGQPYQISTNKLYSTCSIGVTLFNDRQRSTDELLKQADIAMYQAKNAGRNTMRFFDPKMQNAVAARSVMEGELREALENQQFQLYYQIQVDACMQPIGAEALIRWNHPDRGLVPPGAFITLAEETGLILPLGQWILETACAQLKAWQQNDLTNQLVLAVNVSARQFHQADFVAQIQATTQRYSINPMLLKLELTESLLLENVEDTVSIMKALNEIGVRLSLDDFGTGYSSLQYLKRLPLDQIKIDQSFVRELAVNSDDRAIVRTIISMAKSMNLDVIAEGVETNEQSQLLLNYGCTWFQGYLFSKPVPIEEFEIQLKQRT